MGSVVRFRFSLGGVSRWILNIRSGYCWVLVRLGLDLRW